uniref:Sulfhydryl oxidase n=1 Tax=Cajanus cajan TaxID=3821 RepID=A0A151SFK0_CAJCA|nr:FAD-linked sulfhydryl oxidase ALR [Cajanus cajan]
MSGNPLLALFHNIEQVSNFVQHHLSNFIGPHIQSSGPPSSGPLFSIYSSTKAPLAKTTSSVQLGDTSVKGKSTAPVSKEELGRATWTFLHTLAAQYPDNPTRQQKKDVKELVQILTRMYPCSECADHFKEVVRANPVQAGSHAEFSQWLCHVHNVVNRRQVLLVMVSKSLDKPVFPCERVDARWGKLECEQRACEIIGSTTFFGKER